MQRGNDIECNSKEVHKCLCLPQTTHGIRGKLTRMTKREMGHEMLHVDLSVEGEPAWAVRPAQVTWINYRSKSLTSSWCDRSKMRMFASHHQLHTRSGVAAHDSYIPYDKVQLR